MAKGKLEGGAFTGRSGRRRLPKKSEILQRAREKAMARQVIGMGVEPITPTEKELKETGEFEEARLELMRSPETAGLAEQRRYVEETAGEMGLKVVPKKELKQLEKAEEAITEIKKKYTVKKTDGYEVVKKGEPEEKPKVGQIFKIKEPDGTFTYVEVKKPESWVKLGKGEVYVTTRTPYSTSIYGQIETAGKIEKHKLVPLSKSEKQKVVPKLRQVQKKGIELSKLHYRARKVGVPKPRGRTVFVQVKMQRDIPSIVGSDMNIYGPFKKGKVYAVPKDNARIFLKQRVALATRKEAEKPTLKQMFKGEVLTPFIEARKVKPLAKPEPPKKVAKPKPIKTFDFPAELTKSTPKLRGFVSDTYFGASPQQRRLMIKWAKEGYELFDWGTGTIRERRFAEDSARRSGFNPYDIHEINVANYTIWFGKQKLKPIVKKVAKIEPVKKVLKPPKPKPKKVPKKPKKRKRRVERAGKTMRVLRKIDGVKVFAFPDRIWKVKKK